MITTDLLPINVVDGQGFREVIKYIEPGYDIPSRTTITPPRGSKLREEEGRVQNRDVFVLFYEDTPLSSGSLYFRLTRATTVQSWFLLLMLL